MPYRKTLFLKYNRYHAYNRGFRKNAIFKYDSDREVFLEKVLLYSKKFKVRIESYALMLTHFHFTLRQSKDNEGLQLFLARLQQSYANYYNRKYHRTGPVFDSRYGARLIDSEKYYVTVMDYIFNNPLKL